MNTMKIIDAVWEKRNLGVSCLELHFDNSDNADDVRKELSSLSLKEYNVARVPSSNTEVCRVIRESGFEFIEAAITLTHDLKSISVRKGLEKLCESCSCAPMDDSDVEYMEAQIDKGIFATDRISVDPRFGKELSARRYKLWMRDLVAQGNIPMKVMVKGTPVGFFISRERSPKVYDGVLAGVYSEFEGTGMGYCVQYQGLVRTKELGAKKYIGHISGNNVPVGKIVLSLGFGLDEIEYVFIKHN